MTQRETLEAAYAATPWEAWIAADPLWHVRQFDDPREQEIVGLIAAGLAYGRVGSIMPSIDRVLAAMDREPFLFVTHFDPERDAPRFERCIHRFHTPDAIVAMLYATRQAIDRFGSLGAMFLAGHDEDAANTAPALAAFVDRLRAFTEGGHGAWSRTSALYGWQHFLASPADGSACKRLNLYLRWMARTGVPDVGAWPGIRPSQLLVPVDVHVARIAKALGWTKRATVNLAMAREITDVLRTFDPQDPTRYDFVLSHLGMERLTSRLTHHGDTEARRPDESDRGNT